VDTVALGIGLVSAALDATGVFNDDVDYPREKGRQGLALSLEELEAAVQAECLCFMRVAALLRHYVYSEPLPEIWEPDWEFTRLAQFLGMADNDISGRVSSGPCLGWLTAPAVLSYRWCRELGGLVARSHLSARRLVLVNSMWRQPQLLRLPRNYDSIFQVRQNSYRWVAVL
jgi:E3 ubiquitin-protein ligase UBR3